MKNNEIKMVKNLKHNKKTYTIRWQMTSLCNYQCDFCIQGNRSQHIENSNGESLKTRQKICDRIIEFIENELNGKYEALYIYLIGGEVTILKDFPDLLRKLSNCKFDGDIKYYITTNLSLNKKDLFEITNIFKGSKHKKYMRMLYISANFYKDATTENDFMDKIKFIQNPHKKICSLIINQKKYRKNNFIYKIIFHFIKMLEKNNRNIFLSLGYPLVEDNDYKEYKKFYKTNKKYADTIDYIIIRKYDKSISDELKKDLRRTSKNYIKLTTFKDENLYFARTSDISLSVEGGFNPSGMLCDSGVNSISISNLGVISRCISCAKESSIGNIIIDGIKVLEDEFICPSKTCSCNYFGIIKKR